VKKKGGIFFSMAVSLKMRVTTSRHHLHRHDDMKTFVSGRRYQGGDDVAAME
jgi:hypothetical protein